MKVKMLPGHEGEFPQVSIQSIDPSRWVDEGMTGSTFADMRKDPTLRPKKVVKKKKKVKAQIRERFKRYK